MALFPVTLTLTYFQSRPQLPKEPDRSIEKDSPALATLGPTIETEGTTALTGAEIYR